MRELTVQAASGTMTSADKTALNTEFQALDDQIHAYQQIQNGMALNSLMDL